MHYLGMCMHCACPFCWIFNRTSDGVQCCECELVSCFHRVQTKELLVHLCPAFLHSQWRWVWLWGTPQPVKHVGLGPIMPPSHYPSPLCPFHGSVSISYKHSISSSHPPPSPPLTVISFQALNLSPSCKGHPQVESVWLGMWWIWPVSGEKLKSKLCKHQVETRWMEWIVLKVHTALSHQPLSPPPTLPYPCTLTFTPIHAHTCTCMHARTHAHMHTHACTHIHMHSYSYYRSQQSSLKVEE